MEVFEEGRFTPGVINMIMGDPEMITDTVLALQTLLEFTLQDLPLFLKIFGKKLVKIYTSIKPILEL